MILPTVRDPRLITIRRGGTLTDADPDARRRAMAIADHRRSRSQADSWNPTGSFGHDGHGGSLVAAHPPTRTAYAFTTDVVPHIGGASLGALTLIATLRHCLAV